MIDKYRKIVIYEVENGWIVKFVPPEKPNTLEQTSFTSVYCPDKKSLIVKLKKVIE